MTEEQIDSEATIALSQLSLYDNTEQRMIVMNMKNICDTLKYTSLTDTDRFNIYEAERKDDYTPLALTSLERLRNLLNKTGTDAELTANLKAIVDRMDEMSKEEIGG